MLPMYVCALALATGLGAATAHALPTCPSPTGAATTVVGDEGRWAEPATPAGAEAHPIQGVALVFHGLNLQPERMAALAEIYRIHGYATLTAHLPGHRGDLREFQNVTAEKWRASARLLYCAARVRADAAKVPLTFVGFSIGGLLGVDLIRDGARTATDPGFAQMLLIAPALTLNTGPRVMRWFSAILPDALLIPSFSPENYRANRATPVAAYAALGEIISDVDRAPKLTGAEAAKIPVAVVIDPADELVSSSRLEEWLKIHQLTSWSLIHIRRGEGELGAHYHHLMIDLPSATLKPWKRIEEIVDQLISWNTQS